MPKFVRGIPARGIFALLPEKAAPESASIGKGKVLRFLRRARVSEEDGR